ncbi:MAG: translation elongation factor Ts [Candidatus Eremiobacteraeota bacterium]|nr:translation elongation factor Ts [Candidatus Eremiobacteraeota bacterium]MCL5055225.1 translation elongation factor Ts [Bacillota bacterium]
MTQGTTIPASLIKELREKTGAGMMDCRKALEEAGGEMEKAMLILREKGILAAEKKKGRKAIEGRIEAYIHFGGKIGTLIEVNCETDFVARTDEFQNLCKNLAMQVAASNPQWVSRDQVPAEVIEAEKKIYRESAIREGKPPAIVEKIVDGKMEKFFQSVCLLEQPYIKEQEKPVSTMIKEIIGKIGENILVRRFARFALGENSD